MTLEPSVEHGVDVTPLDSETLADLFGFQPRLGAYERQDVFRESHVLTPSGRREHECCQTIKRGAKRWFLLGGNVGA
jgi:hypothetical protein